MPNHSTTDFILSVTLCMIGNKTSPSLTHNSVIVFFNCVIFDSVVSYLFSDSSVNAVFASHAESPNNSEALDNRFIVSVCLSDVTPNSSSITFKLLPLVFASPMPATIF